MIERVAQLVRAQRQQSSHRMIRDQAGAKETAAKMSPRPCFPNREAGPEDREGSFRVFI
jgi:hypothetical protein